MGQYVPNQLRLHKIQNNFYTGALNNDRQFGRWPPLGAQRAGMLPGDIRLSSMPLIPRSPT